MRCPKCHFVSFDHLAQCKKCGTDLSTERSRLNLLDFEPAVPHFLGVFDDSEEGLQSLLEPEETTEEIVLSLADDTSDTIKLNEPVDLDAAQEIFLDEPQAEGPAAEPVLSDIALEDEIPELVIEDPDDNGGLELVLGDEAEAERNSVLETPTEEAPIEFVIDDEDLELELSPEEMERIILELESDAEDPDKTG